MWTSALLLLLLTVTSETLGKAKNRFTHYPSWNAKMYPIWKAGGPRYEDSWKGGKVNFNVRNDSPTLTGAKVTFTIELEFPHNQEVLPDGSVVWAEDCVVNDLKSRAEKRQYCVWNMQSLAPALGVDGKRTVRLSGRVAAIVVAKREAEDKPSDDDCVIYRYGSFCTGIEVFEGIEKVEIVQMENVLMTTPRKDTNVLDITVTCQGSHPKEVCSVILDSDCLKPIHMACNLVEPSKECQLVLRHFFNSSGDYCINVSMANDVSLAAATARFTVDLGSGLSSSGTIVMLLGVLVLILTVGIVGYSYKRLKPYHPLKEAASEGPQLSEVRSSAAASMLWNSLNRQGAIDNSPLLQDRPLFVTGHLSVRLDPMLQAVELPAGIANLDTGLTNVDGDALTLWSKGQGKR
ncbi:hypothetical protein CCH79_00017068, partial [Gambusia affinis]